MWLLIIFKNNDEKKLKIIRQKEIFLNQLNAQTANPFLAGPRKQVTAKRVT
jgi:hypothetical protein